MSSLVDYASETLRLALPYACLVLGGTFSERSGVPQIGLEGMALSAAFSTIAVELVCPGLGWTAGILVGAILGCVHAWTVLRLAVDPIVSGLSINLFALGATRALLRAFYGSSANSPSIHRERIFGAYSGVFSLVLIGGLALLIHHAIFRTRWGLRLSAVGESPATSKLLGIALAKVQLEAAALAGGLAALGGVVLALDQRQFQSQMSGGRGFIALAIVILAKMRPLRGVALCGAFAALEVAEIAIQSKVHGIAELLSAMPYLVTLGALLFYGLDRKKKTHALA